MRRYSFILLIVLMLCCLANAQTFFGDLKKVRTIELLTSTQEDVKRILLNEDTIYLNDNYENRLSDTFYTKDSIIWIEYSTGDCFNENEDWNVEKGKVTAVIISPKDEFDLIKSGINYSGFKRERVQKKNNESNFIYHNKHKGIAIGVWRRIVKGIIFLPTKEKYSNLCNKPEVKKYYQSKKWNRYKTTEDGYIHHDYYPKVVDIKLNKDRIISNCESAKPNEKQKCLNNQFILVSVAATDPENDVLTYEYKVTGGKIEGVGAEVTWNLSNVKPGTYKITAFVDDGNGYYRGKWMTRNVVVE